MRPPERNVGYKRLVTIVHDTRKVSGQNFRNVIVTHFKNRVLPLIFRKQTPHVWLTAPIRRLIYWP